MDTITHGIAGALIGKALFKGDELFAFRPMNRGRIVTWASMLGAIFPDSDTFRDMLSHNDMLMITWHRSITHSLLCLPIFALLLAALTWYLARWRKWDAPSFAALAAIYAVGILSHILLDLVTTFGTMIWSPLQWSRPAWDLLFIVDFTFTGILLVPQILAWVYERPESSPRRALVSFAIFAAAVFGIQALGAAVGVSISMPTVFFFIVILAALCLFPLPSKRSAQKTPPIGASQGSVDPAKIRQSWNRAGLAAGCIYLVLAVVAHHSALLRVQRFAEAQKLEVRSIAALPLPPSLWRWGGLVSTARGVYDLRMDLSEKLASGANRDGEAAVLPVVAYRFYPNANSNVFIQAAEDLPDVKKVLWFDRFPVTRFHEEAGESIVEISDLRFPQVRKGRPAPFTYQVRFSPSGKILSQGWEK
jgi:membrane-bound metal-dependent hydrolase YbcI (DUF457 family)